VLSRITFLPNFSPQGGKDEAFADAQHLKSAPPPRHQPRTANPHRLTIFSAKQIRQFISFTTSNHLNDKKKKYQP
jgi:hypothetical protein